MNELFTLIYNANIWTRDGKKTWMLIKNHKIEKIGDLTTIDEVESMNVLKLDLEGQTILPGLQDAHIHVYSLGRSKFRLQLNKPKSIAEMQNKLETYINDLVPNGEWVVGYNWDQDYMEDKRYPTRYDLDLINKDRSIILFRSCHHIAVLNSKALEELKITDESANPGGGVIEKDDRGIPTGILKETALNQVTPHIKIKNKQTRKKLLEQGLNECLKVGLTTVQTNDAEAWELYSELTDEDRIPIRVYLTVNFNEISSKIAPEAGSSKGLLKCDRVKLFADGSLGGQTAALRSPYADTKGCGVLIFTQEEMNKRVKLSNEAGYRLEVHGIGDLAVESILAAFEFAKLTKKDRPIITHCQVLGMDLIEKMKDMGAIANIQPPFVTTDSQWVEARLGKKSNRLQFSYAWKTIIQNGIVASGGSDSPIENPNPLLGIHAAMFRKDPKDETWRPEEKLTFREAIDLYTQGAAYAIKEENQLGKLKEGFWADFIVLDRDVVDNAELLKTAIVNQVWVDGTRRY